MLASVPILEYDGTPFLERMSRTSGQKLLSNSVRVSYEPGVIAHRPGDPDRAEIIEVGMARLFLSSADGRQATARYVRPGQLMGSLPIFGLGFDGSCQMLVESSAIRLDLRTVRRQLERDQEVAYALAGDLACRYSHTIRALAVQTFGTVVQRVAFDLLNRACREQLASGILEARATHEEIAHGIGSARQVVSRGLTELREAGLIATVSRGVSILDPLGLELVMQTGLT